MTRPFAPHAFSMAVADCLFVHWPFDPERVRPHVPAPLELDSIDGRAWISLVAFVLSDAGLRSSPSFARLTFPELNCRTYVTFDDTPGLYFFSVDVASSLVPPLVGRTTRLPCYHANVDVRHGRHDDSVRFRSVRDETGQAPARFEATYAPSDAAFRAEDGSLDHWLAERRRMYDPVGEKVLYAEIAHDPWPLQPVDATIVENTVLAENGLPEPQDAPRMRYSELGPITGSVPRWIRGLDADPTVRPQRLAHP